MDGSKQQQDINYGQRAKELEIRDVVGGEFLDVDGLTLVSISGHESVSAASDQSQAAVRMEQVGTYCSNNGTLAFVDASGRMHVGHATTENFKALEAAGYRSGHIWVPLSNGEIPAEPAKADEWRRLRAIGREKDLRENIQHHLEAYRGKAKKEMVGPVEGGVWMQVDGVEYQQFGRDGQIDRNTDGYNMSPYRYDQVGTYYSNNGVLAYVDQDGRMFVGRSTDVNFAALQKAGFRSGNIWVPFSNGERPKDREKYVQFRDVMTGLPTDELNQKRNDRAQEILKQRQLLFGDSATEVDMTDLLESVAQSNRLEYGNVHHAEKLGIVEETDDKGVVRRIYRQGGKTFSIRSRQEMPLYTKMVESDTELLGKDPAMVHESRAAEYKKKVEETKGAVSRKRWGELRPKLEDLIQRLIDASGVPVDRLTVHMINDQLAVRNNEVSIYKILSRELGVDEARLFRGVPDDSLVGEFVSHVDDLLTSGQLLEKHYSVSNDLQGLLELATRLNPDNAQLQESLARVKNRKHGERETAMLDALVALKWGGIRHRNPDLNPDAEAILILALSGDAEAQNYVNSTYDQYQREQDKETRVEQREWGTTQPLKAEDLVCVHATRYEPRQTAPGVYEISTTYDATDGEIPRNTVHVAMNHKVQGHMYGSWADAGFAIISPFNSMMTENGLPTRLNTVDTWWALGPGQPLKWKDAKLIAPGPKDMTALYEEKDGIYYIKSTGFGSDDFKTYYDQYIKPLGEYTSFHSTFQRNFFDKLHPMYAEKGSWDSDVLYTRVIEFVYGSLDKRYGPALTQYFAEAPKGMSIEDRVKQLLDDSHAAEALVTTEDRTAIMQILVQRLTDAVVSELAGSINESCTADVIQNMGYKVHSGGMWAWGDSWEVTSQSGMLAEELGIDWGHHTDASQTKVYDTFVMATNWARGAMQDRDIAKDDSTYQWEDYKPDIDQYLGEVDRNTLRMIVDSGLTLSRRAKK